VSEPFGATCAFKVAEFGAMAVAPAVVTLGVTVAAVTVSVTVALVH
jgi:hypothetical protein